MLLLALRNLRARTGRTLFTAFAIALGVALVFATRIVSVAAEEQAAAIRASKLAGATGSEERQEYTLIGDAMNVGARIEQLNKSFPDYDILLSEFTVAAAKGEYVLVDLGEAEIRGKSTTARVFGLGG